jgi:hypothetical protein
LASALVACVLVVSGCGDDDAGGTDDGGGSGGSGSGGGGSVFSCDITADLACFELQVPPGGLQAATDQCTSDGGTPGTGCPTADLVGECQSSPHYFYYTGFSGLDQAQEVCTSLGGTWVAH